MQRCVFDHQLKDYRLLFFFIEDGVEITSKSVILDSTKVNYKPFAPVHTMTTKCWTDAYRWSKDASNQVRIRAADNIYVVVRKHVGGHLTDARASSLIDKFLNFSFLTYDEYTHLTKNVCILREDESRPELYNCTCIANAEEFTCKHSVGIAMRRHTMIIFFIFFYFIFFTDY